MMKNIIKSLFACLLVCMLLVSCNSAKKETAAPFDPALRGSNDFKIAVAGYSYLFFDIETTLKYLQSMDVHYLSVKDKWLPLDASQEEMAIFKDLCNQYGVNGYTLGPIYMRDSSQVDQAFAYAQRYGTDMFICVPNYDLLDYTKEKVSQTGIKVAIHTHGPDGMDFPDIRTVVEKVGDPSFGIGCCMDLGHTFRSGYDVAADIKEFKDWIYDIHIKDETAPTKAGQTWECGRGQMDLVSIINVLREIGYDGMLSLEFEKNRQDPHAGIAESIGYLRGIMDATK